MHILLATDADWIVDEVTAALGDADTRFTVCRDGRSVAGQVDESMPDLAILDLMLEEDDGGFVLCHYIKKMNENLPVIMCSAVKSETGLDFDATTDQERAWIRADAWLPKPIRFEQLQKEITRLMTR